MKITGMVTKRFIETALTVLRNIVYRTFVFGLQLVGLFVANFVGLKLLKGMDTLCSWAATIISGASDNSDANHLGTYVTSWFVLIVISGIIAFSIFDAWKETHLKKSHNSGTV